MKQMNKIVLAVALCASTQAFGVNILFQPDTYGHTYDFLIFETESDYKGMLRQVDIANLLRNITVKIAPFVGKAAGLASKNVTDPEFKAIATSIEVSSKLLVKAASSKLIGGIFQSLTQKGYTVDAIENFKPSASKPRVCLSKDGLKKPLWHKVKSNRNIFYVIWDKTTGKVLYADYGLSYGDFTFSIGTVEATAADGSRESLKAGNMKKVSDTGGTYCK